MLLELGHADPTYPADESKNIIQNTAISEAMVQKDLEALELILKFRAEALNEKSILVMRKSGKPRLIRPLHYFFKLVRRGKILMDDDFA